MSSDGPSPLSPTFASPPSSSQCTSLQHDCLLNLHAFSHASGDAAEAAAAERHIPDAACARDVPADEVSADAFRRTDADLRVRRHAKGKPSDVYSLK